MVQLAVEEAGTPMAAKLQLTAFTVKTMCIVAAG